MEHDGTDLEVLIRRARENPETLGELMEHYRPFLLIVSRRNLGAASPDTSYSDVTQQTLMEACQAFDRFSGSTEPEFSAWIKRIHDHNLVDAGRKRQVARKHKLAPAQPFYSADGSASFCWREPAAEQSSASQKFLRGERALRLAELMQSLPEMQREAVRMRHLEGWPVEEIARELDRSISATAGLIKRGLKALREKMSGESWG
jgi:RNA polymerase sigma-70 factor (ECF subfamily)